MIATRLTKLPFASDRIWIWLLAAFSLAPLAWCRNDFAGLFYFGDEWDQLDQISTRGFASWVWSVFGENFAPMFKLTWGGVALASGGSYFALVVIVWLAHAGCVGLLGCWMRVVGFGRAGTAIAMIGLGLPATNVETLGWTIQLITVQGVLFFLAAGCWQAIRDRAESWNGRSLAILGLLVTLSTFSFVRGPLTGAALATAALFPLLGGRGAWRNWRTRAKVAGVCLLPAVAAFVITVKFSPGNHLRLEEIGLIPPLNYAAWYFLMNPFHRLFDVSTFGPYTAGLLGVVKLAVLALGWKLAAPSQRRLLAALLVFELGNTLLLGLGRYHTGLGTATGSRYQYFALLSTLPFVGVCLDATLQRLARFKGARPIAAAAALLSLAIVAAEPWARSMRNWSETRGRNTRHTLFTDPNPPPTGVLPGISFMTTEKAKDLIARYHLH